MKIRIDLLVRLNGQNYIAKALEIDGVKNGECYLIQADDVFRKTLGEEIKKYAFNCIEQWEPVLKHAKVTKHPKLTTKEKSSKGVKRYG